MSEWLPPSGGEEKKSNEATVGTPSNAQWPIAPPNFEQSSKRRGIPVWVFVLTVICSFVIGLVIAIAANIGAGFTDSLAYEDYADDYGYNSTTYGTNGDLDAVEAGIGSCFKGKFNDVGTQIDELGSAVSCSRPHELEIFSVIDAPLTVDAAYDASSLSSFANGYCELSFQPYIGKTYADSEFTYASIIPSRDAWGEGSRKILCFVAPYAPETVDQSLQNSNR